MSRVRRSVQQEFYDVFADWSLDDQEVALQMLTESHRQARRQERRRKLQAAEAPNETLLPAAGKVPEKEEGNDEKDT